MAHKIRWHMITASEPVAAKVYAQAEEYNLNVYQCGVVVIEACPWLAASSNRKGYQPDIKQQIKCLA